MMQVEIPVMTLWWAEDVGWSTASMSSYPELSSASLLTVSSSFRSLDVQPSQFGPIFLG